MRALVFLILSFYGILSQCKNLSAKKCEVSLWTDKGWLCGRIRIAEEKYKYASFQSVPYGKPPLGELRFKELEPPQSWNGHLDSTEESPACPTKELVYGRIYKPKNGMSEDCIYLNLYIPYNTETMKVFNKKGNSTLRLPILVNIPGGGFESGSGLPDLHGPEYLMTKGVIVVSFNYRLNVFGFLSLRSKEIPGNQGLRDQLTLLRWVQRNALHFGGDPDSVTLLGQSAGAFSAHLLSLSTTSVGLFNRLILLSGTGINNEFSSSPKYAREIADFFLSNLDINSTDPGEIHSQLVSLPLVNIMESFTILQHEYGTAALVPVVEDEYPGVTRVIEEEPLKLIAQGRGSNYPTIIGFTKTEDDYFRWININFNAIEITQNDPKSLLYPRLTLNLPEDIQIQLAERIYQFCFQGNNVTLDTLVECNTDLYIYSSFKLAQWRAIVGAPAYLYQFSYKSERSFIKEAQWITYDGTAHIEDLTYIFRVNSLIGDHVSFPPKNDDDQMKDWMTKIVCNFMRCSNPTCGPDNDPNWPPVSTDKLIYQDIVEPMEYRMSELTERQQAALELLDNVTDADPRNVTESLQKLANSL